MKAVMREVLLSPEFWDRRARTSRATRGRWSSWCARSRTSAGAGFSVNDALTPLSNMGQILYEPPDVSGWDLGQSWFSTGAMLARMNFASTLAGEPEVQPGDGRQGRTAKTPEALLSRTSLDQLVDGAARRDASRPS